MYVQSGQTGKSRFRIFVRVGIGLVVTGLLVWLAGAWVTIVDGMRTVTIHFGSSTGRARRGVVVSVMRHARKGCGEHDLYQADGVLIGNAQVGRIQQRVSWKASPLRGRYDRTYSDEDHVCAALIYEDGSACLYETQLRAGPHGAEAAFTEHWPCEMRVDDPVLSAELNHTLSRLAEARP